MNPGPPPTALPTPLAERLRPQTLEQVVGQAHLLAPGKPLHLACASGQLHSCILWGPPGVGKTTLARVLAQSSRCDFIALSAVLAGVKDIRDAVERAQRARAATPARATLVFVDEVHRFNKAQQDAFLPHVESGLLTFIGATTENPSFEVNSALLSRARVYVLQPLGTDDLAILLERAWAHWLQAADEMAAPEAPQGAGAPNEATVAPGTPYGRAQRHAFALTPEARQRLLAFADGDARRLLNALECVFAAAQAQRLQQLDATELLHLLGSQWRRFDAGGDAFYDSISALHKSVRGSHPDAALYWLVRMLDGGADPRYLARRIVRMASEDIGLADPRALRLALDAAEVYERLGSPEGELALAQAVLYLAVAPKSNAAYLAYKAARELVRSDASRPVPLHLRNAPTRLLRELEHGQGYRYAHDEPEAYAAGARYFPDALPEPSFYHPVPRGLELRIAERLRELRALDAAARQGAAADAG